MQILSIQDLTYYVKDRKLLDIQHLKLDKGKKVGLIGQNGQGKSTLLHLIKNAQSEGNGMIKCNGTVSLLPQLKPSYSAKSGGEISSDYFVKLLNETTGLLLLDEPTTNLDLSHISWVVENLKNTSETCIIVSHDRYVLNEVVDEIWELADGEITIFSGNYSDYVKQKDNKTKYQLKEYDKYLSKKRQLEQAIEQKRMKAERATKTPRKVSASESKQIGAKPYFAKKQKKLHKTAQSLQQQLNQLEIKEKPNESLPIKLDLPNQEHFHNRIIMRVKNLEKNFGERRLWKPASFQIRGGQKIGLIGENGVGKTTFIKEVLNEDNQNIKISPQVKIGYFAQNLSILDTTKTILENVSHTSNQSETTIRTVLARLHFLEQDVFKKVDVLSGGERVKVSLAKIFLGQYNTLILDEPTNYLDIQTLQSLEELLSEYEGTLIIISHDREFISQVCNKIMVIENEQISLFNGTYEEWENYQPNSKVDPIETQLMLIENRISEVLSKLSSNPDNEELEVEFQALLKEKRKLKE